MGENKLSINNGQEKRSFMIEHELEDAQAAYVEATYRFREAEKNKSSAYDSTRREMNRLEKKVQDLRYRLYSQQRVGW